MKEAALKAFMPTLLHTLELFVILIAAYALVNFLQVPLDKELTTLLLAAMVKFGRSTTNDYVNN